MSKMSKKLATLAGITATVLVTGVAFAYWTAGGTGNGDASAGSDNGVDILNVAFSDDDDVDSSDSLYPGSSIDVSFDVENSSDATPVKVGDVIADDSTFTNGVEITQDPDAVGVCDEGWFTYSGTTLEQEIAASDTLPVAAGSGGSLAMSNEPEANQDGCKDATITLYLIVDNANI